MPQGSNGARHALAGYLYQIIGLPGIVAKAHQVKQSSQSEEMTALLETIRQGEVVHEAYGQDATSTVPGLNGSHQLTLIQFKYSSRPSDRPIQPKEFLQIVKALKTSRDRAQQGHSLTMGYVLVTNRQLSPVSQQILKEAKEDNLHSKLARLKERSAYEAILKVLTYWPLDVRNCIDGLSIRAKALGLTESDFHDGVKRLIGWLVMDTASLGPTTVSLDNLDRELAGFESPRLVSRTALQGTMQDEVDTFMRAVDTPHAMLRRPIVQRIEDSTDHLMIVVHGEGGCGKSAALCQVLQEMVDTSSGPHGHYVAAEFASQLPPGAWLSRIVAKWRGAPLDRLGSQEIALVRLERAHDSDTRPVIVLALDGLDEASDRGANLQEPIRDVLRFISEQFTNCSDPAQSPKAVLIVTCRSRKDIDSVWPHRSTLLPDTDNLCFIPVSDFSNSELEQAAERWLPGSVARRFLLRTRAHLVLPSLEMGGVSNPYSLQTMDAQAAAPRWIDEEVYEYLKHPLLWRFFCEVQDEEAQKGILNSVKQEIWKLCENYVDWFCEKARKRNPDFRSEDAKYMLKQVALSFGNEAQPGYLSKDWIEVVASDQRFHAVQAERLFKEATSFGMVQELSRGRWRWRHPIMCEFFASQVS